MAINSSALETSLHHLQSHLSPSLPNPPSCKKRASVALILRIRPSSPLPNTTTTASTTAIDSETSLQAFFAQEWVRNGDPEILFIRRAARRGDRWTGHVAFPGGKRDPDDASDRVAAEREAREEVGLDLATCAGERSGYVGGLPQQIVSTNWGNVPLLVLCPFVYLLTSPTSPTLHLQAAEVASAHWVSIRALLHPSLRTYEPCDISERLTRPGGWLTRHALRALVGKMIYPAVHLVPSESLFCSSTPGFLPSDSAGPLASRKLFALSQNPLAGAHRPLHLWGLTFGIVTDFLQLLPTYEHCKLWAWPTFSHWDIQFVLWLSAWKFRRRALARVREQRVNSINIMEDGFASMVEPESRTRLGGEHVNGSDALLRQGAGGILEGYFDQIKNAIIATLGIRALGAFFAVLVIWRMRRWVIQRSTLRIDTRRI